MTEKKKSKSIILKRFLYGKIRLEEHPKKGFIVSLRGNKEIFWMTWKRFDFIHNQFKEIIKYFKNDA